MSAPDEIQEGEILEDEIANMADGAAQQQSQQGEESDISSEQQIQKQVEKKKKKKNQKKRDKEDQNQKRQGNGANNNNQYTFTSSSYKSQPCQFYKKGICIQGDTCTYSHDFQVEKINQLCKYFLAGNCQKNNECLFSHEPHLFPCKFHHGRGICDRGTMCIYSHEILDTEKKNIQFVQQNYDFLLEQFTQTGQTDMGEYFLNEKQERQTQSGQIVNEGDFLLQTRFQIPNKLVPNSAVFTNTSNNNNNNNNNSNLLQQQIPHHLQQNNNQMNFSQNIGNMNIQNQSNNQNQPFMRGNLNMPNINQQQQALINPKQPQIHQQVPLPQNSAPNYQNNINLQQPLNLNAQQMGNNAIQQFPIPNNLQGTPGNLGGGGVGPIQPNFPHFPQGLMPSQQPPIPNFNNNNNNNNNINLKQNYFNQKNLPPGQISYNNNPNNLMQNNNNNNLPNYQNNNSNFNMPMPMKIPQNMNMYQNNQNNNFNQVQNSNNLNNIQNNNFNTQYMNNLSNNNNNFPNNINGGNGNNLPNINTNNNNNGSNIINNLPNGLNGNINNNNVNINNSNIRIQPMNNFPLNNSIPNNNNNNNNIINNPPMNSNATSNNNTTSTAINNNPSIIVNTNSNQMDINHNPPVNNNINPNFNQNANNNMNQNYPPKVNYNLGNGQPNGQTQQFMGNNGQQQLPYPNSMSNSKIQSIQSQPHQLQQQQIHQPQPLNYSPGIYNPVDKIEEPNSQIQSQNSITPTPIPNNPNQNINLVANNNNHNNINNINNNNNNNINNMVNNQINNNMVLPNNSIMNNSMIRQAGNKGPVNFGNSQVPDSNFLQNNPKELNSDKSSLLLNIPPLSSISPQFVKQQQNMQNSQQIYSPSNQFPQINLNPQKPIPPQQFQPQLRNINLNQPFNNQLNPPPININQQSPYFQNQLQKNNDFNPSNPQNNYLNSNSPMNANLINSNNVNNFNQKPNVNMYNPRQSQIQSNLQNNSWNQQNFQKTINKIDDIPLSQNKSQVFANPATGGVQSNNDSSANDQTNYSNEIQSEAPSKEEIRKIMDSTLLSGSSQRNSNDPRIRNKFLVTQETLKGTESKLMTQSAIIENESSMNNNNNNISSLNMLNSDANQSEGLRSLSYINSMKVTPNQDDDLKQMNALNILSDMNKQKVFMSPSDQKEVIPSPIKIGSLDESLKSLSTIQNMKEGSQMSKSFLAPSAQNYKPSPTKIEVKNLMGAFNRNLIDQRENQLSDMIKSNINNVDSIDKNSKIVQTPPSKIYTPNSSMTAIENEEINLLTQKQINQSIEKNLPIFQRAESNDGEDQFVIQSAQSSVTKGGDTPKKETKTSIVKQDLEKQQSLLEKRQHHNTSPVQEIQIPGLNQQLKNNNGEVKVQIIADQKPQQSTVNAEKFQTTVNGGEQQEQNFIKKKQTKEIEIEDLQIIEKTVIIKEANNIAIQQTGSEGQQHNEKQHKLPSKEDPLINGILSFLKNKKPESARTPKPQDNSGGKQLELSETAFKNSLDALYTEFVQSEYF